MQTTAAQLAEVFADKAIVAHAARRLPRAVEIRRTCEHCEGTGNVGLRGQHACKPCHGGGFVRVRCDVCGCATATTRVRCSDGYKYEVCGACSTNTLELDGLDFAVAFALRTLP